MRERVRRLNWAGVICAAGSLSACVTPLDPLPDAGFDYAGPGAAPPLPAAPFDTRPQWTPATALPAGQGAEPAVYAWIDRTVDLLDLIGQSPPDFAFGYRGNARYGWDVDGWLLIEEPAASGRNLFLFEPGSREPYFVRDVEAGHGFDRGRWIVTYLPNGTAVAPVEMGRWRSHAEALRRHAIALFDAARAEQRADSGYYDEAWYDWTPTLFGILFEWEETRSRDRTWRDYRRQREARRDPAREEQRRRRRETGEAFRRWRDGGFEGPPPAGIDRRRWDRNGDGIPDRRPRDRNGDRRPDRPRDRTGDGQPDRPRDRDGEADRPRDRDGRSDHPGDGAGAERPGGPRDRDGMGRPDFSRPRDGDERAERRRDHEDRPDRTRGRSERPDRADRLDGPAAPEVQVERPRSRRADQMPQPMAVPEDAVEAASSPTVLEVERRDAPAVEAKVLPEFVPAPAAEPQNAPPLPPEPETQGPPPEPVMETPPPPPPAGEPVIQTPPPPPPPEPEPVVQSSPPPPPPPPSPPPSSTDRPDSVNEEPNRASAA